MSLKLDRRLLKLDHRSLKLDHRSLKLDLRSLKLDHRSLKLDHRSLKLHRRLLKLEHSFLNPKLDRGLLMFDRRLLKLDHRFLKLDRRLLKLDRSLLKLMLDRGLRPCECTHSEDSEIISEPPSSSSVSCFFFARHSSCSRLVRFAPTWTPVVPVPDPWDGTTVSSGVHGGSAADESGVIEACQCDPAHLWQRELRPSPPPSGRANHIHRSHKSPHFQARRAGAGAHVDFRVKQWMDRRRQGRYDRTRVSSSPFLASFLRATPLAPDPSALPPTGWTRLASTFDR